MSQKPLLKTALHLLSMALFSWVVVHIMAAVGGLLILGYFVFWKITDGKMLLPNWHRARRRYRRRAIIPVSFTTVLIRSVALFCFTLLSVGVVFIESKIFFSFNWPSGTQTASFQNPNQLSYTVGDTVPLRLVIGQLDTAINAVQTDIAFDSTKLEVISIDVDEAFAKIFVQKEFDNQRGLLRISGGLPNPGWNKADSLFALVYFRAKGSGTARVNFLPSSLILANDGYGTNILHTLPTLTYNLLPSKAKTPTVSRNSQPSDNQNNKLIFGDQTLPTNINSTEIKYSITPIYLWREFNRSILLFWYWLLHRR